MGAPRSSRTEKDRARASADVQSSQKTVPQRLPHEEKIPQGNALRSNPFLYLYLLGPALRRLRRLRSSEQSFKSRVPDFLSKIVAPARCFSTLSTKPGTPRSGIWMSVGLSRR